MKISTNQLDVGVISKIFSPGCTQDGEQYTAYRYLVCAEDVNGNRYTIGNFPGSVASYNEDGEINFSDIREEAEKEANKLLKKITAKGVIDTDFWFEDRPRYGR